MAVENYSPPLGSPARTTEEAVNPPLKVFFETVQTGGSWIPPTEEEVVDPEFEKQYGEAARAHGMTIRQYLNQLQGYADDELKHPFEIGKALVRPNQVKDLP